MLVTARRGDRLRALADEIAAFSGQEVATVVGDIAEAATGAEALRLVQQRWGGLDILVNNAGVGAFGLFEQAEPGRLRRVLEVNFFAPAEMVRLALPLLRVGNRPIVVNVSSVLGHRGVPYSSEYCASKFALQGFSEAVRAEFRPLGIDVMVVSPGTTNTEFFDSLLEKKEEPNWPKHRAISAAYVARRIVAGIRRGRHEIIPSGIGRVMCWLNRLSPALMDWVVAHYV